MKRTSEIMMLTEHLDRVLQEQGLDYGGRISLRCEHTNHVCFVMCYDIRFDLCAECRTELLNETGARSFPLLKRKTSMTPRQLETVAEKVLNFIADPENIVQRVNTPGITTYVTVWDNHDGPKMEINLHKGKWGRWHVDVNGFEIDGMSMSHRVGVAFNLRASRQMNPIEANVIAAFCGDTTG